MHLLLGSGPAGRVSEAAGRVAACIHTEGLPEALLFLIVVVGSISNASGTPFRPVCAPVCIRAPSLVPAAVVCVGGVCVCLGHPFARGIGRLAR